MCVRFDWSPLTAPGTPHFGIDALSNSVSNITFSVIHILKSVYNGQHAAWKKSGIAAREDDFQERSVTSPSKSAAMKCLEFGKAPSMWYIRKLWIVTIVAFILAIFAIWNRSNVQSATSEFYHDNPISNERKIGTYDFIEFEEELMCFRGLNSITSIFNPIPNVVHFHYGLRPKGSELPFMVYLAIRSALVTLKPDVVKLHYSYLNMENEWIQKLGNSITLVYHDPDGLLRGVSKTKWAVQHLSDVLRLDILRKEGGIYLDSDVFALRSFDSIRNSPRDIVLGHEGGDRSGLCNAIILARPASSFLERWIASYDSFKISEWNEHSVKWPKSMSSSHPDEICTLSPVAFFWPTWTYMHIKYMHDPINEEEARAVRYALETHGGALYTEQLAYHAWHSMAWGKYMRHLTPQSIREDDTRFNIMVRRFLED